MRRRLVLPHRLIAGITTAICVWQLRRWFLCQGIVNSGVKDTRGCGDDEANAILFLFSNFQLLIASPCMEGQLQVYFIACPIKQVIGTLERVPLGKRFVSCTLSNTSRQVLKNSHAPALDPDAPSLRSTSSSTDTMKSFPAALLFSLVSRLSAQSISAPLGLSGNKIDPVSSERMETRNSWSGKRAG
ncbi:hypothetical protein HDV64DRAFT_25928 [Trichoderma sp. TUCIM 5745]